MLSCVKALKNYKIYAKMDYYNFGGQSMNENMTVISADMFNEAVKSELTVSEAVELLRQCTKFRTLSDKLNAFAKNRDIRSLLTEGILQNHPQSKREAVDRKVRNWLGNRQNSIAKADAIELCFVLGLDLDESNALLAMISEEGLHWRNPDEIPYIYALLHNMSYTEAQALHERVIGAIPKKSKLNSVTDYFTDTVRQEITSIESEDELTEYVAGAYQRLGNKHNRAYQFFCEMLDKLESPEIEESVAENNIYDEGVEDKKYSVGNIVRVYLHGDDLPHDTENRSSVVLTSLQRSIMQNWPSESVISRMKNRHVDVSRKVLILLFLATYDADDDIDIEEYYSSGDFEQEKTPDEIFREFYGSMNAMLKTCGFSKLDPRAAFDWIAIFCMCREDIFMLDSTLSEFLQDLFVEPDSSGNDMQN